MFHKTFFPVSVALFLAQPVTAQWASVSIALFDPSIPKGQSSHRTLATTIFYHGIVCFEPDAEENFRPCEMQPEESPIFIYCRNGEISVEFNPEVFEKDRKVVLYEKEVNHVISERDGISFSKLVRFSEIEFEGYAQNEDQLFIVDLSSLSVQVEANKNQCGDH